MGTPGQKNELFENDAQWQVSLQDQKLWHSTVNRSTTKRVNTPIGLVFNTNIKNSVQFDCQS